MILSGSAKLAGVMGWPVAHSRSPRLHGYWLERYGIDGAFVPLPVRPERFPAAIRCLADMGFRGVNLTLPHKEAALQVCDDIDPLAQRIGAVNTIVFEDGRVKGSNTDGFGFLENLRQNAPGWSAATGPALVLGAGGAARAIVAALCEAGAPEIRLGNRTAHRAEALAAALDGRLTVVPWERRADAAADIALLVNTTSLGMRGQPELDLALERLPPRALVTDLVYTPLETSLLGRARARGNPVVDGLGMLLHQARPGFAAWFGVAPEVTPELREFVATG
ncbi:MAG: shikimate dehydrogenase [Kiloniellaceae bacterium]